MSVNAPGEALPPAQIRALAGDAGTSRRGPASRARAARMAGVALCLVAVACTRSPAAPADDTAATDQALPRCGRPPSPAPEPPPPGALLPPGTLLTAVRTTPARVQVNGYAESTLEDVREWVLTQPDLEVVGTHQDGLEAEILVTDGTWRTYFKARAVCAEGSLLAQVIAPQSSPARLSTPGGSAP